MLAGTIANTQVMPSTKTCRDGFPYAPANLRQLFIGGKAGKKGENGSQAWQDIFTEKENREVFQKGLDAMENVRVLTEAQTGRSLGAIAVGTATAVDTPMLVEGC